MHVELRSPGSAAFVPVPRVRLRPGEPPDDRLTTAGDDTKHDVPDSGGTGATFATLPVAGFPGETVTAIDLTYDIDSQHWNQIALDLETPPALGGATVRRRIKDHERQDVGGDRMLQL